MLTLDRAVSLQDYEDFSRTFAGVAKAQAVWVWDGRKRMVFLTVAGPDGEDIDENGAVATQLKDALRTYGDPFVALHDQEFSQSAVSSPRHGDGGTPIMSSIRSWTPCTAALLTRYSFDVRAFGQPVALSEVIAVIQSVPGVVAVDIDKFYRNDKPTPVWKARLDADRPAMGADGIVQAAELLLLDASSLNHLRGDAMNPEAEKLYNLLPALYRMRDAEQGGALQALCAVIAEEIAVLRENLDQLYDDQFIETCAEWVAPYIGDLIGYRPTARRDRADRSARAEVANTIAYRRRKGTATVLEQLARDVTGWNARAVEFFQWLETSQYMNHIRPANGATPDLRDWEALERRDTAFNTMAHSVDMRRIETQKGRYNIPNVGLFLWRLDAFSLTRSPAFRIDDQRFLFSPLGNDMQLFTRPESETDISHLAEPINVPEPISRRVLRHVSQPLLRAEAARACSSRRTTSTSASTIFKSAILPTTARAGRTCR